ncbi:MAG: hypothetical protein KGJ11_00865 [Candidatus Omnitrophica bacterium]|nr:hypothetical protein [Candidatus Omnitrophota bacterium]
MISEGKIINEVIKARNKRLFDWGLSFETAGGIEIMEELLTRVSIDPFDKQNTAHSLFIGIIRKNREAMLALSNDEIKALIEDGFSARQERRRKRVRSGIVTLNNFVSEFSNGMEIFEWLVSNNILNLAGRSKGYFKSLTDEQRYLIESSFPSNFAKIIAILEMSRDTKITIKTKKFYEIPGTEKRLNL